VLGPGPDAAVSDRFQVWVIDRPSQEEVPFVMVAAMQVETILDRRLNIRARESCVSASGLSVSPNEERNDSGQANGAR